MKMRASCLAALLAWASPAALTVASDALAARPDAVHTEVFLIVASNQDGGTYIDPQIGDRPELKKKPLNAFNHFRLLDKQAGVVVMGAPRTFTLRNPSSSAAHSLPPLPVKLTLVGISSEHRYRMVAEFSGAHQIEVTLNAGESVFVGGEKLPNGEALIFGFTPK